MKKLPEAVFVADVKEDKTAVLESIAKKIPIIALVDTNEDPTVIDYPIPSNDDAVGAIKLITDAVVEEIIENRK